MERLLITSSSADETITNCLLKNPQYFSGKLDLVLINDLLKEAEIYDHLDDNQSSIEWTLPGSQLITNKSHILLNRVLDIPTYMFEHFIKDDQQYAQREFEAYLGFALSSFDQVCNTTVRGTCEWIFSLPQQWQMLQAKSDIATPDYYWGPPELSHLAMSQDVIYGNLYNFYNWQCGNEATDEPVTFCFQRPKGEPLFVCSIGDDQLIENEGALSNTVHFQLIDNLKRLRQAFGYYIFECLFFLDDEQLTFACINPRIIRLTKHEAFERFVCNRIIMDVNYAATNLH